LPWTSAKAIQIAQKFQLPAGKFPTLNHREFKNFCSDQIYTNRDDQGHFSPSENSPGKGIVGTPHRMDYFNIGGDNRSGCKASAQR
jgi:hypothetical protein